jgi:hypothetical protein
VGTAATQGDWSLGEGDVEVSAPRAETAHAVALPMRNTAVRATGGLHRQQMRLSATAGARGGISAVIEARPGARTALGLASPSTAVSPVLAIAAAISGWRALRWQGGGRLVGLSQRPSCSRPFAQHRVGYARSR